MLCYILKSCYNNKHYFEQFKIPSRIELEGVIIHTITTWQRIAGVLTTLVVCLLIPTAAPAGDEVFFERGHFYLTIPPGWEHIDSPAFNYDYTLSAVLLKTSSLDHQNIREQIGVTTEYTYSPSPETFFQRVYQDTVSVPGVKGLDQGIVQIAQRKVFWFTYQWELSETTILAKVSLLHTPLASHRFIFLAPVETFETTLVDFDQIVASYRPGK